MANLQHFFFISLINRVIGVILGRFLLHFFVVIFSTVTHTLTAHIRIRYTLYLLVGFLDKKNKIWRKFYHFCTKTIRIIWKIRWEQSFDFCHSKMFFWKCKYMYYANIILVLFVEQIQKKCSTLWMSLNMMVDGMIHDTAWRLEIPLYERYDSVFDRKFSKRHLICIQFICMEIVLWNGSIEFSFQ